MAEVYDPNDPWQTDYVTYRIREGIMSTLTKIALQIGGINVQDNQNVKAIQRFCSRCTILQDSMRSVWIPEWDKSVQMKHVIQEIHDSLQDVLKDCQKWQQNWIILRLTSTPTVAENVDAWRDVLDDAWRKYTLAATVEGFQMVGKKWTSLIPLLHESAALPIFQGLAQGGESEGLRSLVAEGMHRLETNPYRLTDEDRTALLRSLRSLMTVDKVPACLWLTGKVTVVQQQARDNRISIIDKGLLDGKLVAVKHLRGSQVNPNHETKLMIEGAIWRLLYHPNVLRFYGLTVAPMQGSRGVGLVSGWAANGDVMTFLTHEPNADVRAIVKGTAAGIAYLHSLDIAHGSLRGENILLNDDCQPLLTDFGLANALRSSPSQNASPTLGMSSSEPADVIRWLAPELITRFRPTKASDIFGFGRTILEIMTGSKPFKDSHPKNVLGLVAPIQRDGLEPRVPNSQIARSRGLTSGVWALLRDTWKLKAQERPDIEIVLNRLQALMP